MEKKDDKLVRVYAGDVKMLEDEPLKFWEGVTKIGKGSFADLSNLKEIEIPACVTEIEERAFMGCKNLSSVKLCKDLKFIANWAFICCDNLKSVEIPYNTAVSHYAFERTTKLNYSKEKE